MTNLSVEVHPLSVSAKNLVVMACGAIQAFHQSKPSSERVLQAVVYVLGEEDAEVIAGVELVTAEGDYLAGQKTQKSYLVRVNNIFPEKGYRVSFEDRASTLKFTTVRSTDV